MSLVFPLKTAPTPLAVVLLLLPLPPRFVCQRPLPPRPQPLPPCPPDEDVADVSVLPPWAAPVVASFSLIVEIKVLWSPYYRCSVLCFNCYPTCSNYDDLSSVGL
jgi:hypothetical protein